MVLPSSIKAKLYKRVFLVSIEILPEVNKNLKLSIPIKLLPNIPFA